MSPAPAVPVVLTVVFALTGLVSLVEYARVVATPRTAGAAVEARAVAVLHVLMSVAMIAMAWGLGGGPSSASGTVQLVVFGLFALAFGVGATLPTAARPARLPRSLHALAALAMVWMVAVMPTLMGSAPSSGSAGGHDMAGMAGMSGMTGMDGAGAVAAQPAGGPASGWVLGLTGALVAVLTVAALTWLVAAVRTPARSALAAAACPASSLLPGTSVAAAVAHHRSSRWACCHVLMSGGMAAMLATML